MSCAGPRWWLAPVLAVLTGCAVVTPVSRQVPSAKPAAPKPPAGAAAAHDGTPVRIVDLTQHGYRDIAGVIHIHTIYSDGAGSYEDIGRTGNQLSLDYLIATDHNTLKPLRDGKQGWYGMTLLLIGSELSTRAGHYLALNVRSEVDITQPTQAVIDEVARQGGLGFICHPFFYKHPWTDWSVRGFVGIEGFNTVHDALDGKHLELAFWGLTVPPDQLYLTTFRRPDKPLATWDGLLSRHGRVVGIGSSDAHEVRLFGLKIAPYDIMFKLVRTHLVIPKAAAVTEAVIYEALGRGHAFFSVDLVTDSRGFMFIAHDQTSILGVMGDTVPFVAGLTLTASLPAPADLTLLRDGEPVAATTERTWHVPITEPGTYRLEARRHDKPWIFSNPIYVQTPSISGPSH